MATMLYYIVLPFVYLISILPFRFLFFISNGIYYIVYYLVKYRRKIALENLTNSFPEKSAEEINHICKRHYRYLCDLFFEVIKTLTISKETVKKHVHLEDTSLFRKYQDENQSIILVIGHFGNWEIGGARFSIEPFHQLYVLYHPLKNKHVDKLVCHMRTRLGTRLYKMKTAFPAMLRNKDLLTATAFIADQTPRLKGALWTEFLNQDTPVFTGTEKIAKKLKYPVLYVSVNRIKRGKYSVKTELLCEHPELTDENEITIMHTKRLEQDIIKHPEIWLWTHHRWKHKRKPENK